MDRTVFYNIVITNDIKELDYLHNSLENFKMNNPPNQYVVQQKDLTRPDLISYRNYGSVSYWWIILYVNKVVDPFEDLEVGQILTIPSLVDIYNFHKKYRVR